MRGAFGLVAAVTALLAVAAAGGVRAEAEDRGPEPVALAVLNFEYVDTSGEPANEAAAHQRRLADFMGDLRRDLAASGRYRIVSLACGAEHCTSSTDPFEVQKAAKAAGVKLVVSGGVHKMSSLIEWAKIQIADEDKGRVVFDRLLSFRGDSDEAWRKAEAFGARQILDASPLG